MISNGYGSYSQSLHASMAAYDEAPLPIRWLMRNAVAKWAPQPLVDKYWTHRRAVGHAQALTAVRRYMIREEAKDTQNAYSSTHPDVVRGQRRATA